MMDTALSDQGNHLPYILHRVYYLKDREGQASGVYHTCSRIASVMNSSSFLPVLKNACKHNVA